WRARGASTPRRGPSPFWRAGRLEAENRADATAAFELVAVVAADQDLGRLEDRQLDGALHHIVAPLELAAVGRTGLQVLDADPAAAAAEDAGRGEPVDQEQRLDAALVEG